VSRTTVAVLMVAYNHEKYIRDAIEGVLMQRGNFDLRLVIGEDCGTDRTRSICEEYATRHPDVVKLLPSEKNHGVLDNVLRVLRVCLQSDYIAICEGDDKWIDAGKLQHQVDFLVAHPEYDAHSHNVIVRDLMTGAERDFGALWSGDLSLDALFNSWPCHAVSQTIRSAVLCPVVDLKLPHFISADRFINRWIACHGRMYYDGERKMAVYHRHDTGASQTSNRHELCYQEYDMLESLCPFVPAARAPVFYKAKANAIRELALSVAYARGPRRHQIAPMLAEYVALSRLRSLQDVYFFFILLLGRPFYLLNEFFRGRDPRRGARQL